MIVCKPDDSLRCWSDQEAAFYLRGLDASSYAEGLAAALRPGCESLLEIGAGDGRLGERFTRQDGLWTALEPNGFLFDRLRERQQRRGGRVVAIRDFWQNLSRHLLKPHQSVLCANISGTRGEALRLWNLLRPLTRRQMVWIVSAQEGPATFCLANLLPLELHGRPDRPAWLDTMEELRGTVPEPGVSFVSWNFQQVFADLDEAVEHFEDRLRRFDHPPLLGGKDSLRAELRQRLHPLRDGSWLAVSPKKSAILQWHLSE